MLFFVMIRGPPRSRPLYWSAASDGYKGQVYTVWREEQRVLRALRDRGAKVLGRLEALSTAARALGFTALGVTAARLAGLAPWRGVWTTAGVLVALAAACALGYGITRRTNQEAKA